MAFYVDKSPLYSCSVCNAEVRVETKGGVTTCHFDKCGHTGAKVFANRSAVCTGKGSMTGFVGVTRRFKNAVGSALSHLLGRSVSWQ